MRQSIQRVLEESSFQQHAKSLRGAMVAAGGVHRAAEIVEEALTTKRPVRRESNLIESRDVCRPGTNNH
jgi:hypothetical protein